jgi:hypothetical protein
MVVVFGHKIQVVYQPHWLLQPWMQHRTGKILPLKLLYSANQP